MDAIAGSLSSMLFIATSVFPKPVVEERIQGLVFLLFAKTFTCIFLPPYGGANIFLKWINLTVYVYAYSHQVNFCLVHKFLSSNYNLLNITATRLWLSQYVFCSSGGFATERSWFWGGEGGNKALTDLSSIYSIWLMFLRLSMTASHVIIFISDLLSFYFWSFCWYV